MNGLIVVAILLVTAQVVTQPKLLEGSDPAYPDTARAYGIDGIAGFRATVSPEGTVTSVSLLFVPRSNLGFEDAVEQAVRKWRFAPAMLDGKPVIGSYVGQIRFVLPTTIKGEAMYPRRSREVWMAVDRLMQTLGFRAEKRDDALQIYVTHPRDYRMPTLPDAAALGLAPPLVPQRFQLNVYVTPNMEPARVAIGAVVHAAALVSTDSPGRRLGTTLFSPAIINEWFLSQLSAVLGVTPEAMPSEPDARAAQSRRLMPPGVSDACSTNSVTASHGNLQALTPPRRIYEFHPPYPGRAALDQKEAVAVVEADLTEHGTMVRPSPREGNGDFQIAAQQAVLLWRFEAARSGGCPVPVRFTVTVQFRMP